MAPELLDDVEAGGEPLLLRLSSDGRQIVLQASARKDLGADLQKELATWKDAEAVPWRFLVRLCAALRERGSVSGSDEAWLHVVTAGSQLVLPSPHRPHDPAYEDRIQRLRIEAQEREYQSLVSDLTRKERFEKERVGFRESLKEVGYGMHVITVMFTCFIAGYVVGRRLSSDKTIQYGVGCLGMIAGMMVEAGLFMIRFQRLWDDGEGGNPGSKGQGAKGGAGFAPSFGGAGPHAGRTQAGAAMMGPQPPAGEGPGAASRELQGPPPPRGAVAAAATGAGASGGGVGARAAAKAGGGGDVL